MRSPLVNFSYFYFIAGMAMILLCWFFVDTAVAKFLAVNWLAVGIALALITFGARYKKTSDVAGFVYLLGFAWLAILFAVGVILIWKSGIGVEELDRLLD